MVTRNMLERQSLMLLFIFIVVLLVLCFLGPVVFFKKGIEIIAIIFGMVFRVFYETSEQQNIRHTKTCALEKDKQGKRYGYNCFQIMFKNINLYYKKT